MLTDYSRSRDCSFGSLRTARQPPAWNVGVLDQTKICMALWRSLSGKSKARVGYVDGAEQWLFDIRQSMAIDGKRMIDLEDTEGQAARGTYRQSNEFLKILEV